MCLILWRAAFRYGLSLFAIMLLAGCALQEREPTQTPAVTLEVSLTDRSLLRDEPCSAPCWHGLELGISTKSDALRIARTLSFIDPTSFPERPDSYWDQTRQELVPARFVRLLCRQPVGDTCAGLLFVNDVLKETLLSPNYYLSFADVVGHLGLPDYVSIVPTPGHQPLCNLALIWKQRHVSVGSFREIEKAPCDEVRGGQGIDPSLPVEQIAYMLPDDIALTSVPEEGRDFPWPGFAEP